jgi:chaperonin GroES
MLKPLEDRVIVQQKKEAEKTTASGLVLSTMNEPESNQGTVVAVGEGRVLPSGVRVEMDVAVGDKIIFNPYATQKVEHDGEEYHILFTKDILAILEGEDA